MTGEIKLGQLRALTDGEREVLASDRPVIDEAWLPELVLAWFETAEPDGCYTERQIAVGIALQTRRVVPARMLARVLREMGDRKLLDRKNYVNERGRTRVVWQTHQRRRAAA